jgi:hypothetical protein
MRWCWAVIGGTERPMCVLFWGAIAPVFWHCSSSKASSNRYGGKILKFIDPHPRSPRMNHCLLLRLLRKPQRSGHILVIATQESTQVGLSVPPITVQHRSRVQKCEVQPGTSQNVPKIARGSSFDPWACRQYVELEAVIGTIRKANDKAHFLTQARFARPSSLCCTHLRRKIAVFQLRKNCVCAAFVPLSWGSWDS